MADDIRLIRSYVLEEGVGSVGTVCIYQPSSPEAIRRHAGAADPSSRRDRQGRRHSRVREDPRPSGD
jgi:hypothetical protein